MKLPAPEAGFFMSNGFKKYKKRTKKFKKSNNWNYK